MLWEKKGGLLADTMVIEEDPPCVGFGVEGPDRLGLGVSGYHG